MREGGGRITLAIKENGVYLDGAKLDTVTRIDIVNINAGGNIEVVIHARVDELDIQYKSPKWLQGERKDIRQQADKIQNGGKITFDILIPRQQSQNQ